MSEAPRRVIRTPAATVWLVVTAAVVALLLVDVLLRSGWSDALLIAPWLLLPAWLVFVFVYAPHIAAGESGATVHNPVRTTWIPWGAVGDVVLRWQIEFRLFDGRRIQSWGAPAKKQTSRSREQPAEREIEILLELRETYRAAHPVEPDRRVIRTWNLRALFALAILVVWGFASLISSGGLNA